MIFIFYGEHLFNQLRNQRKWAEVPRTWAEVPRTWAEVPRTRAEVPRTRAEAPRTRAEALEFGRAMRYFFTSYSYLVYSPPDRITGGFSSFVLNSSMEYI
jgi:hypothetical protein